VIIDCHVHTRSPGCRYHPDEIAGSIRLAQRAGIEHMIQLHNLVDIGGNEPSQDGVTRSNDLAMQIVAAHPEWYSGFCYLNPAHDPAFLDAEIERCVARGNLCGIKLWISVHATDTRLDPIMRHAAALNVPVLHHAWYKMTGYVYNESTPAEIADLACRHPDVTIVMAHLAGDGCRGVRDVKHCPNVLVDTSGGQPVSDLVEYAVRELGAQRVIYGSDWPIRDYATQKARVTGANIPDAEKELILGGNAARLLAMKERGGVRTNA
jgi:predicted TIM-barrel fold metal-dependent hydrolase